MKAAEMKKGTEMPLASARKRFGRYKEESESAQRKPKIMESPVHEGIMKLWKTYSLPVNEEHFGDVGSFHVPDTDKYYRWLCSSISIHQIRYTSRDVERFCLELASLQEGKFFDDKAGVFLSALVNMGKEEQYRLQLDSLDVKLNSLGFMNRKILIIHGDTGLGLGVGMEGGEIHVMGEIKNIGTVLGGKIFHKGKLIVDK